MPTFDDPKLRQDDPAATNMITKYVQASAGATFSVFTKVSPTYLFPDCDSIVFKICSEGLYLDSKIIKAGDATKGYGCQLEDLQSRITGQWRSHPLRFSPVNTSMFEI